MAKHDFSDLWGYYPDIIQQMPDAFASHQFILELACQHQQLYVEALHAYRDAIHRGKNAPFRVVHQILARHLHGYADFDGWAYPSTDIFGHAQRCGKWRRRP